MNRPTFTQLQTHVINQLNIDIEALFSSITLPSPLKEACHYAITGNGKRVRPLLVANSYASSMVNANADKNSAQPLTDGKESISLPICVRRAMLAVELLHGYSLIHDDLPCMDDDALRRGRPTCHIKFGEATALLAGDALQSLAFEVLTADLNSFESENKSADEMLIASTLLQIFAPRARRMVSGQMLDIEGEQKSLNQHELQAIHQDKTGALIEAAVLMGAACAGANSTTMEEFAQFASKLGLAFQVQDDILDVTADTQQLGKPAGSDDKLDKSTYVKLKGIDGATEYARNLFDECKQHLSTPFDANDDHRVDYDGCYLGKFADVLWERKK